MEEPAKRKAGVVCKDVDDLLKQLKAKGVL
jgi:hypothetical protein